MRTVLRRGPLAALVAASLLVPAGAALGAPGAPLDAAEDELAAATRDLDEVDATVRRINDEVGAADVRLRQASTSLAQVSGQLDEATAAAATAAAEERDAATVLGSVTGELAQLADRHRSGRDRLAQQAVSAYKRGGSAAPGLAFGGLVRADDLHEIAVTRGVLTRLLVEQRSAVESDATLTRSTAAATAEVAAARRRAVDTARTAATERRRVADLVTERERLVAAMEQEAVSRRTVLAELEADAAARAALVAELETQVAALQIAAASVRAPVRVDLALDGPPPPWAAGLPGHGRAWAATVDAVAAAQGLDGRLLAALVWTESNFQPDAVSHAGALGMSQLMPGTARGLGVDPRDPVANITGGARYLATQLDTFGRVDLALAAYNAGPGRVRGAGNAVPDIVETQLYVVRVLDRYRALAEL